MTTLPLSQDLVVCCSEVKDSRGRPTVAVQLSWGLFNAYGDVPAGASKGADEARTVSLAQAHEHIHTVILPLWQQQHACLTAIPDIVRCEQALIKQAGNNFAILGANATLPMSRALWSLVSQLRGESLYQTLRAAYPGPLPAFRRTQFLMNIFNGGLHALKKDQGEQLGRDRIDIQEIMVVPCGSVTYQQALLWGEHIDQALHQILVNQYGAQRVGRADEAGFSVAGLGNSTTAIEHVFAAIEHANLRPGIDVKLALDVAASSFFVAEHNHYQFMNQICSAADIISYLEKLCLDYPGKIFSIEDGLDENDWQNWQQLSQKLTALGVITVGDDLFVTQLPRLQRGIGEHSAHAVLIKVNQNGSVYGTLEVMAEATRHGMACIVSHRSGETLDDSIADLAVATRALGIKTGDPQPPMAFPDRNLWVRRQKYLRMLAIEQATT